MEKRDTDRTIGSLLECMMILQGALDGTEFPSEKEIKDIEKILVQNKVNKILVCGACLYLHGQGEEVPDYVKDYQRDFKDRLEEVVEIGKTILLAPKEN